MRFMVKDKEIYLGEYRLDELNECLWRGEEAIPLRPKAFAVLKYLAARPGQLVTKRQLLDAVWTDAFVSDAVLKDNIRQLREALGDDAKESKFIETAHRRGYRLLRGVVEMRSSRFDETDDAYLADALPGSRSIAEKKRSLSGNDIIGRETDIECLRTWFRNALVGDRQIVFVTGEPGIGKTMLVESFIGEISAQQNIRFASGQCLEQFGEGEPYLPVIEAVTRLAREESESRFFAGLLERLAPTWLDQIPSLKKTAETDSARKQMTGGTREGMLREMAEAIEALSAETPLVLVLEDLHWGDYSTLDLISYLARRRTPAKLMIIGTYRPAEAAAKAHPLKGIKQELQIHGLCRELRVGFLNEKSVSEYLQQKFPGNEIKFDLTSLIHRRTRGNPLFMVNVAEFLADEQIIIRSHGEWQIKTGREEADFGVPENIRLLVERQVERLSDQEQRVLEAASVVGIDCSAIAISAGSGMDIIEIEEVCDRLARAHQFLLPPYVAELPDGTFTPRYKFIHVLYLDALYQRVPVTRRSQIHRRIGVRGEEIYGARSDEIAAELAVHFEQARDLEKAVKYLVIAVNNALLRFAKHEAAALARKGLDLIRLMPESTASSSQRSVLSSALKLDFVQ